MTVLLLAKERDAPADRIVRACAGRGVTVFRADLAWFPSELYLAARLVGPRWTGVLTTRHRGVRLDAIRAVWCRDPGTFGLPAELTGAARERALDQARLGLGGVLACLDAVWVNDPNRARDARYRPLQLATASACGLAVARTLVTNDPLVVHDFARDSEHGVRGAGIHYAWRFSGYHAEELAAVPTTAHQFQDWIDVDHTVWVVAVGERLFPVAAHVGQGYRRAELPDDVALGLRRYLEEFGLVYAVIELAVDRGGRHLFLGSDASGRYGRLESALAGAEAEAPITEAIVDLLTAPERDQRVPSPLGGDDSG
jgi:hypothetical protein